MTKLDIDELLDREIESIEVPLNVTNIEFVILGTVGEHPVAHPCFNMEQVKYWVREMLWSGFPAIRIMGKDLDVYFNTLQQFDDYFRNRYNQAVEEFGKEVIEETSQYIDKYFTSDEIDELVKDKE
jgi:hypothetical protein